MNTIEVETAGYVPDAKTGIDWPVLKATSQRMGSPQIELIVRTDRLVKAFILAYLLYSASKIDFSHYSIDSIGVTFFLGMAAYSLFNSINQKIIPLGTA